MHKDWIELDNLIALNNELSGGKVKRHSEAELAELAQVVRELKESDHLNKVTGEDYHE
ncbi:hypothetical protein [Companilactobacillus mishanensis]|uniref:hypothetical protein n=1 Tax=Companilactobacillus mishanensis TaxID=2486008 RepID=UPI001295A5A1|nr:hypothetical protein [Companilactobacillus mishanensis]